MEPIRIPRLIKPEDMNHHGSLYAGRLVEWFIEATYICAARSADLPGTMVCLKIHDLVYKMPFRGGDILTLEARAARAGKSSLTIYGKAFSGDGGRTRAEGYVTFVCVDERNRPVAHGLSLPPARDAEDKAVRKRAANL